MVVGSQGGRATHLGMLQIMAPAAWAAAERTQWDTSACPKLSHRSLVSTEHWVSSNPCTSESTPGCSCAPVSKCNAHACAIAACHLLHAVVHNTKCWYLPCPSPGVACRSSTSSGICLAIACLTAQVGLLASACAAGKIRASPLVANGSWQATAARCTAAACAGSKLFKDNTNFCMF